MAFFEFTTTLASLRMSGEGGRSAKIRLYPGPAGPLETLRSLGIRCGVVTFRRDLSRKRLVQELATGILANLVDPRLVVCGSDVASVLEEAAAVAEEVEGRGTTSGLVAGEARDRAAALAAGFAAAPHPVLAPPVFSEGLPLRYARLRPPPGAQGDWRSVLREQSFVAVHVAREPGQAGVSVYGIADVATLARLDDLGFWIDRLGREDEPQTTTLVLLRDDRRNESGFLSPGGNSFDLFGSAKSSSSVVASTHQGLVVAVPAGRPVVAYRIPGALHGHSTRLAPAVSLLGSPLQRPSVASAESFAAAPLFALSAEEAAVIRGIEAGTILADISAYSGAAALSTGKAIDSRDIFRRDNLKAVRALENDLETRGLGHVDVHTLPFTCTSADESGTRYNVEAKLPAPASPADRLDGIVMVTAHLDSTAEFDRPYNPASDPAPGADDDASGIAAVLSVLDATVKLLAIPGPRREIRFVLFNAEERGKLGSDAYVADSRAHCEDIRAVFHLDMIGYDGNGEPVVELHAGSSDPCVAEGSRMLASLIEGVGDQLRLPLSFQRFPSKDQPSDPGEDCSDHQLFHQHGIAACFICEDFFPGPGNAPGDRNVNWHRQSDEVGAIAKDYATAIVQAVAGAVWIAATRADALPSQPCVECNS
ncbi:MAG TPA: M28 family peptidase [Longimicrobium sp.]|nr:M28 family peptidase [Longimicrobium sp.]